MKKSILCLIMIWIAMSCSKDKGENVCAGQNISFFDESGNDLFSQDISGHLDTLDLKAYKLSGEELSIVYGKINGVYEFLIGINPGDFTTIIQIGEITTDTLFANFKEVGNSLFIHQAFYNGRLIMTNEDATECGSGKVVNVVVKPD
jgi:hypothetical protein